MSGGQAGLITTVALYVLASSAAMLVFAYRLRRARIAQFARSVTDGMGSQRDAVFALGRTLYLRIKRGRDPTFLTRLLAPLGASPIAVLEHGGCCSGIHRLFTASLDAIGIRTVPITVYRLPGPVAAHRLVQVALSPTPLIIDVDYGVWYRHPNGRSLTITDLRAGVIPVIEPFVLDPEARRIQGKYSTPPGYPNTPYYAFDFRSTRTANWTKSPIRRAAYWLLQRVSRGRVNCLALPPICAWPEILLAAALSGLGVIISAAELTSILPS